MAQVGQQVFQVSLEHLSHFFHRFEAAAADPSMPVRKKFPPPAFAFIFQEFTEYLFCRPRPCHFQPLFFELGEGLGLFGFHVLRTVEPQVNVRWGELRTRDRDGKPVETSTSPCVEVQVMGTTKELIGIRLMDNSFSRRPPIIVTDAIDLNLQPDPQPAQLQNTPPQTHSPSL